MRSAFGVDHGDISKARVQAAQKVASTVKGSKLMEGPEFGERMPRLGPSKFDNALYGTVAGSLVGSSIGSAAFSPKKRRKRPVSKGLFRTGTKVARHTGDVRAGWREPVHLITDVGTKRPKDIDHNVKWAGRIVHKPSLAAGLALGGGLGLEGAYAEQSAKKKARAQAAARKAKMNG